MVCPQAGRPRPQCLELRVGGRCGGGYRGIRRFRESMGLEEGMRGLTRYGSTVGNFLWGREVVGIFILYSSYIHPI